MGAIPGRGGEGSLMKDSMDKKRNGNPPWEKPMEQRRITPCEYGKIRPGGGDGIWSPDSDYANGLPNLYSG